MSIYRAMYSGVSGMAAEGQALGVVGDNVANSNTVGFKQSRSMFEDVLGGAIGTNAGGSGVRMLQAQQIFAQGTLLNTGQPTDLALSGDGFFVVNGMVDGVAGDFYTRAGQTKLNAAGKLVNPQGLGVQGYTAKPDGTYTTTLGDITVSTAAIPPKATTSLTITANLDSSATAPTAPWDPTNPVATSNFSTTMKVYDSLGNAHSVDVYFRKSSTGAWSYAALANGSEVTGGTAGTASTIASGTLSFSTGGALSGVTTTGGTVTFNGAAAQTVAFDFGSPTSAGGTGLTGLTQFSSPSNISAQSQNGYASGDLINLKIEADGVVKGVYSNGQAIAAGKIAVAKFRSTDGLGRAGHNLWVATQASGDASVGNAGSGGRAALVAGALEQSNVDIAQQFVELIAHQRAFQANSKTITTADEMLQETLSLKR